MVEPTLPYRYRIGHLNVTTRDSVIRQLLETGQSKEDVDKLAANWVDPLLIFLYRSLPPHDREEEEKPHETGPLHRIHDFLPAGDKYELREEGALPYEQELKAREEAIATYVKGLEEAGGVETAYPFEGAPNYTHMWSGKDITRVIDALEENDIIKAERARTLRAGAMEILQAAGRSEEDKEPERPGGRSLYGSKPSEN